MIIIVLGSRGMAGHTITHYFKEFTSHITIGIARELADHNIDIEYNLSYLEHLIENYKPDIIINCIGLLIKNCNERPDKAIYINSFFPHWLEKIAEKTNTKIIHLSTNCIFKETLGNYLDTDIPDGDTWYAKTKAMGEITNNKDLTIRLSIIGNELKENGSGLFGWFMKQKGKIDGYSECYWNGITTLCLAQNLEKIIETNITGLYQLAPGYNIDKYSLCQLFKKVWNKQDIIITPNDSVKKNGTLINSYRKNFQPIFPINYEQMLIEMKEFMEKENG